MQNQQEDWKSQDRGQKLEETGHSRIAPTALKESAAPACHLPFPSIYHLLWLKLYLKGPLFRVRQAHERSTGVPGSSASCLQLLSKEKAVQCKQSHGTLSTERCHTQLPGRVPIPSEPYSGSCPSPLKRNLKNRNAYRD